MKHVGAGPEKGSMRLSLPGGTETMKFSMQTLPKVPILVNTRAIAPHTRLVALDDPILGRQREQDKATKKAEAEDKKEKAARASSAVVSPVNCASHSTGAEGVAKRQKTEGQKAEEAEEVVE